MKPAKRKKLEADGWKAGDAAYMSSKPVSIWVYDIPNCYGLMLAIGDPF